ncbi:MAG: hypothetical protein B7Z37_05645 [Verrucomicrobia bacterium 12-59-8]|nr:MAG: hypothetical protein B7Z37_05645 [Verrucomicrobia bacterium 12-59-8]
MGGEAGRGAVGAPGGLGAIGAPGGFGAVGGASGRATGGGIAPEGAGAAGGGEEATGIADVVFLEGGDIGGAGSFTGAVLDFGAGGGSGAEGRLIGAVDFFDTIGTTEVVLNEAGIPALAGDTGAVDSRGWVTPVPGRPRSVMRTVSFFSGTAAVLGVEPDGGDGGVFSGSLMIQIIPTIYRNAPPCVNPFLLPPCNCSFTAR